MPRRAFNIEPFDQDSDEDRYIAACARLRNVTPHSLLKRLLNIVARDQLIPSILDDADHLQEREPGERRFRGGTSGDA